MIEAPENIAWLVEAVGEDEALAFIEGVAGQRLVIPRNADGSRFETLYGSDIARAVCEMFGGVMWEVPTVKGWRARILARRGLTDNEIAIRCGINYRSVRRLLERGDQVARRRVCNQDDRQTSLF